MAYSNRRALQKELSNSNKYYLSKAAFLQSLYFAYQYQEFLDELEMIGDGSRAISYDSQPHGEATGGALEDLAIRRAKVSCKIDAIESACREASSELYKWLIKGVTSDEVGYDYLRYQLNMPCGRRQYYEIRRKFYFILYQKISEKF